MNINKQSPRPPRFSSWLLGWLVSDLFNTHAGDFEEFYHIMAEEQGKRRANWWYRGQVLRLIPDQLYEKLYWGTLMFKSYLLVGVRNLKKSKVPTAINVLGLSAAIGSSIALFLFVYGLNTADSYHENVDDVFLIGHTTEALETIGDMKQKWGTSPVPMGPALVDAYPQIERAVRYSRQGVSVRAKRIAFRETASFADPGFFDLFTFPLAQGSSASLENPSSVIISAVMATKYFGEEEALDKELVIRFANGAEQTFIVGAVAEPFPVTASFTFDFLFGFDKLLNAGLESLEDWQTHTATFLDLRSVDEAPFVEAQLAQMIRPDPDGDRYSQVLSYFLDSVGNPDFLTTFLIKDRAIEAPRPIESIMFGVLAAMMLLVSCFNYITIALGSVGRRLREIGIRKATGAQKKQLIQQFLTENLVICFLALVGGVLFAWVATIPFMNSMVHTSVEIQPGYIGNSAFWLFLVVLLAVVGLVSGSYPAFYISSFHPVEILRGKRKLGEKKALTRFLTTTQFVLTIGTICFATFAWSIDDKLISTDWGYEPDRQIVLPVVNEEHFTLLNSDVSQLASVNMIAGTQDHVGANRRRITISVDGEDSKSYFYAVGPSYLETMGLPVREGRIFNAAYTADDSTSVVVNQAFVNQQGWDEPLGQSVRVESNDYSVVGVIDDFMLSPYSSFQEPVIFGVAPAASFRSMVIEANSAELTPVIASIQSLWEANFPELDFSYYLQADVYDAQSLHGLSVFMGYVALFALLISCMGLFGMASQKAAQRMKEIGIRKSMGASAAHLLFVVNREFLVMLGLATLIATPLCYWGFANTYMRYASAEISQSMTPFIVANVLVFAVAILSLSLQSRKLLNVVPAVVLRND
jgi:ABC-type antimicrobial peptide transport system permease subunit